jgi:hypothetical protein
MKINLFKQVSEEALKSFLSERKGEIITESDFLGREIPVKRNITFNYDLGRLASSEIDKFESEFVSRGYEPIKTSKNELWVSSPEMFNLEICVYHPAFHEKGKENVILFSNQRYLRREEAEQKRTETFRYGKNNKKERKIPVLREIPKPSKVHGTIAFEEFEADPMQVLEIVKGLGYSSSVTTTIEELEDAIVRAKKAQEKSGFSRRRLSGSSSYSSDRVSSLGIVGLLMGGF